MISNESKKWFLYSNLPDKVNRLYVYMLTENHPEAEKAFRELTEYLKTRLDTIAKVTRVDVLELFSVQGVEYEDSLFPLLSFQGGQIVHNQHDIVKQVSETLPVKEFDENIKNMIKALKDGKDLL